MADVKGVEGGRGNGGDGAPRSEGFIEWLARVSEHYVPDALTTAIILMVILAGAAFLLGLRPGVEESGPGAGVEESAVVETPTLGERAEDSLVSTVDAYYRGLWNLLAFTMQMTLMLALSLTLAETRPFKRGVIGLSRLPKSAWQVVVGAVLVSAAIAYANWGLAIALSPLVAVHFCKQAELKGLKVDFVWMMAILAGAGSVWQFGLSSTAPLQMTSPDHFLKDVTPAMPLATTIWSPASIVMVVSFLLVTMVTGILFMPKRVRPISEFAGADGIAEAAISAELAGHVEVGANHTFAQKVERTSWTLVPMWIALGAWLVYHFFTLKASLDINSMVTILLLSCLLLHRTVHGFTSALQRVLVSTWPVIVMYHLYAGVAGLIQFTDVGPFLAESIEPISTAYTLPFLTAVISTVVAIFIPTSGGQWQIQGYVTVATALEAGISPQRNLLALGIGDHMGNLISPFWAVVGAGIAKVDFRLIFGYRLVFAAIWFVMGVVIFTFLPC